MSTPVAVPSIHSDGQKAANKKTNRNDDDIERYLAFLAHEQDVRGTLDKEIFTFSFMDLEGDGVLKGLGVYHGTIEEMFRVLDLNPEATLHVTLNRTNMRGRRAKDIVNCRVLCVDLDQAVEKNDITRIIEKYSPGMVVESSPGRYHLYWKIDSTIPLEVWSDWQLGLAALFNGDTALRQVTHTIRVPGLERIKNGERVMPRIVYLDGEHTAVAGIDYWSTVGIDINHWIEIGQKGLEEQKKLRRAVVKGHTDPESIQELLSKNPVGRNETLLGCLTDYCKKTHKAGRDIELEDLVELATGINAAFPAGPLDSEEVLGVCRKVLRYSGEVRERLLEARREREARQTRILAELVPSPTVECPTVGQGGTDGTPGTGYMNGHLRGFEYDYSEGALKVRPFSDESIVERVLQRFKDSMVWAGKTIFAFDAEHSVWRSQKTTHEILQGYVRQAVADALIDPRLKAECMKPVGKHGKLEFSEEKLRATQDRLLSHRLIAGSVSSLSNNQNIRRTEPEAFDANPFLFFCANGVVNLLTGELRAAEPSDMMLRRSRVVYDPWAKCPWFEQFIGEIFAANKEPSEVVRCMQEVFGYTLTGDIDEQVIVVHSGDGANGKSRLMGVLSSLMGEYASRLQAGALTKSKGNLEKEATKIGAKSEGRRVMIVDDLESKASWDDSIIKAFTDRILTIRILYENERDIPNRAKFHVACNQKPDVETANIAMQRRLKIFEYKRTFEVNPEKADEIDRMIEAELSGILNWCIAGLRRVQGYDKKRIAWAAEVTDATEEYWDSQAGIEERLEEFLEPPQGPGDKHTIAEVLAYLEQAARKAGLKCSVNVDRLGKLLSKAGFEKERSRPTDGKGARGVNKVTLYAVRLPVPGTDQL